MEKNIWSLVLDDKPGFDWVQTSTFKNLKIHYYIWVWTNIFTPKDPFITLFCTFKINVLVAKAAPSLEDSIINNNTVQHRQDNLEADGGGGSTSILKDDDNSGTILVWLSTQVLLKKTPPMMMQRPPRWCWLAGGEECDANNSLEIDVSTLIKSF